MVASLPESLRYTRPKLRSLRGKNSSHADAGQCPLAWSVTDRWRSRTAHVSVQGTVSSGETPPYVSTMSPNVC
jgi:hypothetical protein